MIFRSPYPDVVIPETSVTTYVLSGSQEFAGKTALIDGTTGATTSYGELADAIRRVAGGLAARGFGKGDVLGIYSPNTVEYPIAFHGAAHAGGVVTTVNPHYTPPSWQASSATREPVSSSPRASAWRRRARLRIRPVESRKSSPSMTHQMQHPGRR